MVMFVQGSFRKILVQLIGEIGNQIEYVVVLYFSNSKKSYFYFGKLFPC